MFFISKGKKIWSLSEHRTATLLLREHYKDLDCCLVKPVIYSNTNYRRVNYDEESVEGKTKS
jgi:hypothetical protein